MATYYVDYRRGDDSNDGLSKKQALESPDAANAKASEGDTVYVFTVGPKPAVHEKINGELVFKPEGRIDG